MRLNPSISKIIEEAYISGSGDLSRTDPTSRNSDPTSSEQISDEHKPETLDHFRSSNTSYSELSKSWKTVKDHPTDLIIGDNQEG